MKTITFEMEDGTEVQFPAVMVVCPTCDGTGSILCEGLRGQVMDFEDWDEEEIAGYYGDRYDVRCTACEGRNVICEIDRANCVSSLFVAALSEYDERQQSRYDHDREVEAERRMGC